jgi:hypothetical protein
LRPKSAKERQPVKLQCRPRCENHETSESETQFLRVSTMSSRRNALVTGLVAAGVAVHPFLGVFQAVAADESTGITSWPFVWLHVNNMYT